MSRAWSPFCSQVVLAIGPFEASWHVFANSRSQVSTGNMSNSNLFLPGCSVAYGLKLSLLWAKVHSLQDCKLAWDCLGFHVSAKKQQQLVSKLSIQELTPATPAIQCTWCRRKSLPNDSEADHEQSLEVMAFVSECFDPLDPCEFVYTYMIAIAHDVIICNP